MPVRLARAAGAERDLRVLSDGVAGSQAARQVQVRAAEQGARVGSCARGQVLDLTFASACTSAGPRAAGACGHELAARLIMLHLHRTRCSARSPSGWRTQPAIATPRCCWWPARSTCTKATTWTRSRHATGTPTWSCECAQLHTWWRAGSRRAQLLDSKPVCGVCVCVAHAAKRSASRHSSSWTGQTRRNRQSRCGRARGSPPSWHLPLAGLTLHAALLHRHAVLRRRWWTLTTTPPSRSWQRRGSGWPWCAASVPRAPSRTAWESLLWAASGRGGRAGKLNNELGRAPWWSRAGGPQGAGSELHLPGAGGQVHVDGAWTGLPPCTPREARSGAGALSNVRTPQAAWARIPAS